MKNPLEHLKRVVDNVDNRFKNNFDPNDIESISMLKMEIYTAEIGIRLGREAEQNIENFAFYNVLESRINHIRESSGVGND